MHQLIGIDLGRSAIDVAFPSTDPKAHPRDWRTHIKLDLTNPAWWSYLMDLIAPDAVVAAEPTGMHTLAPIARLIHQYRPGAQVWQVDHRTTGLVRESRVSRAKNDRLDSIALCLIAADIAAGQPPIGCQPFTQNDADLLVALRLLVNQQFSLTRETTRHTNRLRALAYQIFPPFARSATYMTALENGLITIPELRAAAASRAGEYADGRVRRPLELLLENVPDLPAPPLITDIIRSIVQARRFYQVELAGVDADIQTLILQPPLDTVTRRWMTLKGCSPVYTAALHVASGGHVLEMGKDDFVACLGANPRTAISGDDDRTSLTKRGYRPARQAIHVWTVALLSPNLTPNPIFDKFHAVKNRTGKGMGAAKTKLVRVLWGIARNPALDPTQ